MICMRVFVSERGMTFLEVLVVMGIFVMVGSFALFVSFETFRGSNFRSDRNLFVAALQRARAQAVNNVCVNSSSYTCVDGRPHGVKVLPDGSLIIFQGLSYGARDSGVDAQFNMNIATTTGADEFVFSQLSGTSSAATTTITDANGHTSTTSVSTAGQISWTN